jgi:hypothetical protein
MDDAEIKELVRREPWRAGQGWQVNALDPTWLGPYNDTLCNGRIEWSGSTWWCAKCGYCGFLGNTRHPPVRHPHDTLLHNVALFLEKRHKQGRPLQESALQLAHAFGAVTRLLLDAPPNDLVRLVDELKEMLA